MEGYPLQVNCSSLIVWLENPCRLLYIVNISIIVRVKDTIYFFMEWCNDVLRRNGFRVFLDFPCNRYNRFSYSGFFTGRMVSQIRKEVLSAS